MKLFEDEKYNKISSITIFLKPLSKVVSRYGVIHLKEAKRIVTRRDVIYLRVTEPQRTWTNSHTKMEKRLYLKPVLCELNFAQTFSLIIF